MAINYCKTCDIASKEEGICRLNGAPIDLEKDYCSKHTKDLSYCMICGRPILSMNTFLEQFEEEWYQYCAQCATLLTTCQVCTDFQNCLFETDPNPLPKVVTKTMRQGNMVMQTQVKNEEREKELCVKCKCWNEEYGCMKSLNDGCSKKTICLSSRNSVNS